MSYSFPASRKLKSEKIISRLFQEGKPLFKYPIRLVYLTDANNESLEPIQYTVSVPKKRFKRAVDRNLLKRRMREGIRLNQHSLTLDHIEDSYLAIMMVYISDKVEPSTVIHRSIEKIMAKLQREITDSET